MPCVRPERRWIFLAFGVLVGQTGICGWVIGVHEDVNGRTREVCDECFIDGRAVV